MKFSIWFTAQTILWFVIDLASHAPDSTLAVDSLIFAVASAVLVAQIPMKKR